MSNVRSTTLLSFPLLPILGLILVTLKLTGFIAWSWWLVLLPFYGVAALGLAGLLICVLVAGSIQVAPHVAEGFKQGLDRRELR